MDKQQKKSPPHTVEGPVRRPEDIDRAGTGGPYGHTVPPDHQERTGEKEKRSSPSPACG
jgi:hypothetical protein